MKWNRYSIKTTTQAVDLISSALDDIGIEGIEIQDNVQLTQEEAKTMFVDFIPELPPDDGTAVVVLIEYLFHFIYVILPNINILQILYNHFCIIVLLSIFKKCLKPFNVSYKSALLITSYGACIFCTAMPLSITFISRLANI